LAIVVFAVFSAIAGPLARRRHRPAADAGPAVCDVRLPGQGPSGQGPSGRGPSGRGPSDATTPERRAGLAQ
ncbi:hypothetical protein MCM47_40165, partial [Kitasatospora sp. A2-31]|nr:hypothetical protein [Kitasatospora sp. A2-31]